MALMDDLWERFKNVFDGDEEEPEQGKVTRVLRPVERPGVGSARTVQSAYEVAETPYAKMKWLTGASDSRFSSWNNDFMERMFAQQKRLMESGELGRQFSQPDATGVVSWDHVNENNQELRFGDVFDNGQFVGNLYDDVGEQDANLMMSSLLLDATTLQKVGESRDPAARLQEEIARVREANNVSMPAAIRQMDLQKDVDARQESFGIVDDVAGVAGAALTGAAVGARGGPWGAIIGALGFGVGAFFNRDDLSEQMASGIEITKRVYDADRVSGIAEGFQQAAGVLGRVSLSPVSNIVRGVEDARAGEIGDGTPAFMNEDVSITARTLDIFAALADAGITFSTPASRLLFMTQMGTIGAANIGQLTVGTGQLWNAKAAEVDNVYGNGAGNAAMAWGAAAINVVQLGFARGLANTFSGSSGRGLFKAGDANRVTAYDKRTVDGLKSYSGNVDDKIIAETHAGRKFFIEKDTRKVVGVRLTTTTLAPSEAVMAVSASSAARKLSNDLGRQVTTKEMMWDDLYRASQNLAMGQNKMKTAWVNAFGEGTEEALQEVLHQASLENNITFEDVATAYAYGAAMGLGMSVATNYQQASAIEKMRPLVEQGFNRLTGMELKPEEWDSMDMAMKRYYAANAFDVNEMAAFTRVVEASRQRFGSVGTGTAYESWMYFNTMQHITEQLSRKDGSGTNYMVRAVGANPQRLAARLPDGKVRGTSAYEVADDAAPVDAETMLERYMAKAKYIERDKQTLTKSIELLTAELDSRVAEGLDTSDIAERIAKKTATLNVQDGIKDHLESKIIPLMESTLQEIKAARAVGDIARIEQVVLDTNIVLDKAYRNKKDAALRMAVAAAGMRSPYTNVMVYAVNAPAISITDEIYGVRSAQAVPITDTHMREMDFDGDRSALETSLLIDPDTHDALALGAYLSVVSPEGEASVGQASHKPDEDFALLVRNVYHAKLLGDNSKQIVLKLFSDFADMIQIRYGLPNVNALSKELKENFIDSVPDKPIETLLSIFQRTLSKQVSDYAAANYTNEWTNVVQIFRSFAIELAAKINAHETREASQQESEATDTFIMPSPEPIVNMRVVQGVNAILPLANYAAANGFDNLLRLAQVAFYNVASSLDPVSNMADRSRELEIIEDMLWKLAQASDILGGENLTRTLDVQGRVKDMAVAFVKANPELTKRPNVEAEAFKVLKEVVNKGAVENGAKPVTMAQIFLRSVVADIRTNLAVVIQRDPKLAQRLEMYENAAKENNDTGRAMIIRDALGAFTFGDLIGETALRELHIPPGASIENIARSLQGLSQRDRRRVFSDYKTHNEYKVNPLYKETIDTLSELTNTVITINDDGTLTGQLASSNDLSSKNFAAAWTSVREAMQFRRVQNARQLQDLISTDPMNVIPLLKAMTEGLGLSPYGRDKNDKPYLNKWVYDVLLAKDAKTAEKELWLARIDFLSYEARARAQLRENKDDIDFDVKDTLTAMLVEDARNGGGMYSEIRTKISALPDREAIEKYLNSLPATTRLNMPIMMYENNVETFKPSLAKGGWLEAGGSSLRLAMREAVSPASTFAANIKTANARKEANKAGVAVLVDLQASGVDLKNNAVYGNYYKAALEAIENAGSASISLSFDAQINTLRLMLDLQPGAAKKGVAAQHLQGYSASEVAKVLQTGYVDPAREYLSQKAGVYRVDAIWMRPSLLLLEDTIVVDMDGRIIDTSALKDSDGHITPDSLLHAMATVPALRELIVDAISDITYIINSYSDNIKPAYTRADNLYDLIHNRSQVAYSKDPDSSTYSNSANREFGRIISTMAQKYAPEEVAKFEREVLSIALSRILGKKQALSDGEITSELLQAWNDLAEVLRLGANIIYNQHQVVTGPTDSARRAKVEKNFASVVDTIKDTQRDLYNKHLLELSRKLGTLDIYEDLSEQSIRDTAMELLAETLKDIRQDEQEQLINRLVETATNTELDADAKDKAVKQIQAQFARLNVTPKAITWFEQLMANNYFASLKARYYPLSADDTVTYANIEQYLRDNNYLIARSGAKSRALEAFRDNVAMSLQEYQEAAGYIMRDIIDKRSAPVVSTSDYIAPITEETEKFFDHTYGARLDFLKEHAFFSTMEELGAERKEPAEDINAFKNAVLKLYSPKTSPIWTTEIANTQVLLDAPFNSASAGSSIPLSGSIPKIYHSLINASFRSYEVIAPDRAVEITVWLDENGSVIQVDPVTLQTIDSHEVKLLEGAMFTGAKTLTGEDISVRGNRYYTAQAETSRSQRELRFTHLDEVKKLIENAGQPITISYFNPFRNREENGAEFNSIYFDGVIALRTDASILTTSILDDLIFGLNGLNMLSQRQILDAIKKKINAIVAINEDAARRPDLTDPKAVEEFILSLASEFVNNFRLTTDPKKPPLLGPAKFRGAVKLFSMMYVVKIGNEVVPLHTYFARVQAGDKAALTGELIPLSKEQQNTLYGEIGLHGLDRGVEAIKSRGSGDAFSWDALTDTQQRVLDNIVKEPILLQDSVLTRVPVRPRASDQETSTAKEIAESITQGVLLYRLRDHIIKERFENKYARESKINWDETMRQMNDRTLKLDRQNNETAKILQALEAEGEQIAAEVRPGYGTNMPTSNGAFGIIVVNGVEQTDRNEGNIYQGFLSRPEDINTVKKMGGLAFGDVAVVDLDQFVSERSEKFLLEVIDYLASHFVEIRIKGRGSLGLRAKVSNKLRNMYEYQERPGMPGTFNPVASARSFAAYRALEARAMQQGPITAEGRAMLFALDGFQEESYNLIESQMYLINPLDTRAVHNVIEMNQASDVYKSVDAADNNTIVALLNDLTKAENKKQFDLLASTYGKGFQEAFDVLMARATDPNEPSAMPRLQDQLTEGMLIPFIIPPREVGGQPRLYLHVFGSTPLKPERISDNRKQIYFVANRNKNEMQSVFEGRITRIHQNNGNLNFTVDATLQEIYNKLQMRGAKGVTKAPNPELVNILMDAITKSGSLKADLVGYGPEIYSKLGGQRGVLSARDAFVVFGTNQEPLWFKGAYGVDYDVNNDEHPAMMDALRSTLTALGQQENSLSTEHAVNSIEGLILSRRIDATLHTHDLLLTGPVGDLIIALLREEKTEELSKEQVALFAAVTYLQINGTSYKDIRQAAGFTDSQSHQYGYGSREMPDVYTRIFDSHNGPNSLKEWALNEVRSKLGPGWDVLDDYRFRKTYTDAQGVARSLTGYINYGVIVARGEQGKPPIRYDEYERPFSWFNELIVESMYSGEFAGKFDDGAFTEYVRNTVDFDSKAVDGYVPLTDSQREELFSNRRFLYNGVAEEAYKGFAYNQLKPFFAPLDLTDPEDASLVDLQQSNRDLIVEIASLLFDNVSGSKEHLVHAMVRLMSGRAGGSSAGNISVGDIAIVLQAIKRNIAEGQSPMYRGVIAWVPAEIRREILRAGKWAPNFYDKENKTLRLAVGRTEIDAVLFGAAFNDKGAAFDPAFKHVVDGIYHQYLSESNDTLGQPVSLDSLEDLGIIAASSILQEELQAAFTTALNNAKEQDMSVAEFAKAYPEFVSVSLDRLGRIEMTPQAAHGLSASPTLSALLGTSPSMDEMFNRVPPPSAALREHAMERMKSWRKRNKIKYPVAQTLRGIMNMGSQYQDSYAHENVFIRTLLAVRAALALLNPALMPIALVESRNKNNTYQIRKLLSGEATGMFGNFAIKFLNSGNPFSNLLIQGGAMTPYTNEQLNLKRRIAKTSATTSDLKQIIHQEIDFLQGRMYSQGVPGWVVWGEKVGSAMQDLSSGTKAKTATNAYLDAVISNLYYQGVSLDWLLARLSEDGGFVARGAMIERKTGETQVLNYAAAHNAGIQAINDLRMVQQTTINMGIDFMKSRISQSGNAAVNAGGSLLINMPLMFSKYAFNFALSALGLRGIDQLAAVALDGRQKGNGFFGRIAAAIEGKTEGEFDPFLDLSEITAGLDLMDSFMNMGITHTKLFLGGLLFGGLGLSGEDEETKRRRRAANAQGAGFLYDPRRLENDFRNQGAVFLDWLPEPFSEFFRVTPDTYDENGKLVTEGRSMAQLHWTIKPLFSPLIGMERFFNTGDIRQLWWGYTDAFASMPLINTMTVQRAHTAAAELTLAAEEAHAGGGVAALPQTAGFLTTMIGYYESMLMESSFINSLYTAFDDYDRNPYVLPLKDSEDTLQRDIEGNVRPNDRALTTFVDDEGNVQQGYLKPNQSDVTLGTLTENRATLAVISSLFTGMSESKYWRYNMPVKTRKFDKPETSTEEAKAIIIRQFMGDETIEDMLTGGEMSGTITDADGVRAVALSFLNEEGTELVTHEGARAILRGLAGGSVQMSSESLQGVYIDFPTRQAIQDEWMDEIIQEGVDLGMTEYAAKNRMYTLWNGAADGSIPGIKDILWSDEIPYSQTSLYQQLNTTYIVGPDGTPWATAFPRSTLAGALGVGPLVKAVTNTGLDADGRMNVVDPVMDLNLGMRGLKRVDDSINVPTEAEIGEAIVEAIEKLNLKNYSRGGGFGGGGGGGGFYGRPVNAETPRWFNKNLRTIFIDVPYANDIRPIYTENFNVQTTQIRGQRITGERGRLNQWQ